MKPANALEKAFKTPGTRIAEYPSFAEMVCLFQSNVYELPIANLVAMIATDTAHNYMLIQPHEKTDKPEPGERKRLV